LNDIALSQWLHSHPDPSLIQAMLFITHWHNTIGVLLMTAVLGAVLYRMGQRQWLLPLLLCVPGGMLLNVGVKQLVQRARPQFDDPLVTLGSYSFPSGHAAAATLFYGFLTAFLLAHLRSRGWKAAVIAIAVTMVLLVGFSRVYLGAHYPSDVVGGIVEGLAWLLLCLGGIAKLRRRRRGGPA
jgi:membrane-associated phospholipid phosphatase